MTERGIASVDRTPTHIVIGPSRVALEGERLMIEINEWTAPLPRRLTGTITIDLGPVFHASHRLDLQGRHHWQPIAPLAEASVSFDRPELHWKGRAYVDMNTGSEPLEAGFQSWTWSRQTNGASMRILYDVELRDGIQRGLALEYRKDGSILPLDPEPVQRLPGTGWRVARSTRAPAWAPARIVQTLEDTPFYSRSLLGFDGGGSEAKAVNESVDLDRFASRWVQMLLPFKMPRRG